MNALLAGWRTSLRRTRADWPIVAAAGLVTLLAATLLAAGPIYASAAAEAGLRRSLLDAPVADANVRVSTYARATEAAAVDAQVSGELRQLVEPLGGVVLRAWRGSETLAIPELPGSQPGDQAIVGFLEGLPDRATLVAGAWPGDAPADGDRIDVAVGEAVADGLGIRAGDALTLVVHPSSNPIEVPVRVTAVFAMDAPAGPYWLTDEQLLTGVRESGSYRVFGPFLASSAEVLDRMGMSSIQMQWTTYTDYGRLTGPDVVRLRDQFGALSGRLGNRGGEPVQIVTELPRMLADADRSLLVSRTGVLLLMAQLGVLAAYAIILTATLLVEHRRIDTALLRSRGASARDIAMLAAVEGLIVAGPAVIAAPWLAVAALEALNVAGPLADAGLRIAPVVTWDAYLAAAAAGIVAIVLLVLPAALAARAFAAERGGLSRSVTRTIGQRLGLDVALLAVTGIALWQLRLYGAPLTRTVQGTLGLDPLLVAAPAIGLLAGAIVALRIMPRLAELLEAAISRGAGLVASLGSRQLARRPLRYTRSALLLMLAVSMGVFALSYAATWSLSQREQAAYQTGADVRIRPGTVNSLPGWARAGAFTSLPGVTAATPVERLTPGVVFVGSGSASVLALDAGSAVSIVRFRPDGATKPLDQLLAPLREARPEPDLVPLPEATAYLRIAPAIDPEKFAIPIGDPEVEEVEYLPVPPAEVSAQVSATIVDAHGLIYQASSQVVSSDRWGEGLVLPLFPSDDRGAAAVAAAGASVDGPIRLVGLGIDVWMPQDSVSVQGPLGIAGVATATRADGPWQDLATGPGDTWRARFGQGSRPLRDAAMDSSGAMAIDLEASDAFLEAAGGRRPAGRYRFAPASIATTREPIPVLVNRSFADVSEAAAGDRIDGQLDGIRVHLVISGIVETFPTTDPAKPWVIVDEPTLGLLRLAASGTTKAPAEFWLAAADGQTESLAEAASRPPFAGAELVSLPGRTRALSNDAVALGIVGALVLGAIATAVFAVVGLGVSTAVSARQRRTEFALLRALGLSGRQLSATLWLENASLVLVSLAAGTGLGILIGWLVLPFVTVTQRATAPIPPPIVQVPWDGVLLLNVLSGVTLAVAVVLIGRVLRRLGMGSILRMGDD